MLTVNSTLCNDLDAHFKYIQWAEADFKSQTWLYLILNGICIFMYFPFPQNWDKFIGGCRPIETQSESDRCFALPHCQVILLRRETLLLITELDIFFPSSDTKYKLLGGEGQTRYNDRNAKTVMSFRSLVIVILAQVFFCLLTSGGIFLRLWLPTCQFQGSRLLFDILLFE